MNRSETPSFNMKPDSTLPMPEPEIHTLQDGNLLVSVGPFRSIVSSWHLTEEKVIRLQGYYRKAHPHLDL